MKKILLIFILLSQVNNASKADVIYDPFRSFGLCLSLELIANYEMQFTKYHTFNIWIGTGAVSSINSLKHPALGSEVAIELRHYFKPNSFRNFNMGIYAGLAFMHNAPYFYGEDLKGYENLRGFVPGIKLTYKLRINKLLAIEPYFGASTPFYIDQANSFDDMFKDEPGLIITFGIRVGINHVKSF